MLVSSAQLPSAASSAAAALTISAIVKDTNNNLVSGAFVAFQASGGGIAPQNSGVTDSSGTATALLTTGGDPTNQVITITATSGSATASLQVPEIGTSVGVTGPAVIGSGAAASYTVSLTDSSSKGIPNKTVTLSSALKNGISPASATTDANGQATFTYTGTTGGSDTLSAAATGVNAANTTTISVSPTKLVFESPAANASILFGTVQTVKVQYTQNGSPVQSATVNFSATRGTLNGTTSGTASATTDANGEASVTIQSNGAGGAGGAIISAQVPSGPSATVSVQFVATTPSTIGIQASPSTIAPSGTSTVTAVVRDPNDNLVAGQIVNFSLSDPTGGSLSAASGTTDQSGSVTVTYKATTATSAQNGVVINASVNGTSVSTTSPAQITVGAVALRITLGTGNTQTALDATRYQLPYSVLVTDAAGNPPPNGTTFNLTLTSVAYEKGYFVFPKGASSWQQVLSISTSDPDLDSTGFGCKNEDVNLNGILDPGEDYNGNGVLDPGNVASVPSTITLDATGSAQFQITFPKDHALWVKVKLTGIAAVAGTETTTSASFVLPGLASDYSNASVSPPGAVSPYGQGSTCANPN